MQPPSAEGPTTTGRHRAVPAEATEPAASGRLARLRDRLAAFSAHPPRALRWAMLGAALVILVAVPMMSLSNDDGQNDTTATETARETPLDSEPTAAITPALPTGTVQSTLPGLPSTSSAAPPPAAGDPATEVGAHDATPGGEEAGAAPQGGTSDGHTVGGSGSGQGGGSATTTRAPAPAGQPAGAQSGSPSSASSQSSSAQKPAPTSSTPAQPTKTCILDLLNVQVCI